MNFKKALSPFKRKKTVEVFCGNEWYVEILPFSTLVPLIRKKLAELRAGGAPKKTGAKGQVASVSTPALLQNMQTENATIFDTPEADYRFFAENAITGWRGLSNDDTGENVPYSADVAYYIFTSGEEGERLYKELLQCSLTDGLFQFDPVAAGEDEKNL